MKKNLLSIRRALTACGVFTVLAASFASGAPPEDVTFSGPSNAPISAAVALPAGRALFLTSGTVPPVADESAPAGNPARYGDTKTQGIGALKQIEARLKEAGLGLKVVVYVRF